MMTYVLVFFSGFASLIYQVLWMKQLGLLFGNTAHAASATLAAFFTGLAVGSWFWGRRCARSGNFLRIYSLLEGGIAVTALLYFVILGCYYRIYPSVYQSVDSAVLLLMIKFALALLLIFPPAFCMGGTIPVIGQYLIRRQSSFGSTSALLYCVNTLGAAVGAGLAGFYLPLWLGFKATCIGAMLVTGGVAITAFMLSRKPLPKNDDYLEKVEKRATIQKGRKGKQFKKERSFKSVESKVAEQPQPPSGGWLVATCPNRYFFGRTWHVLPGSRLVATLVCFLSGFGVLALEVIWTRMFAQVLENSVYTFAAILVIVLLCLAAGAFISSRLARLTLSPFYLLSLIILISGIAVAATPFVFMHLTNSLQILVSRGSWFDYIFLIFKNGFLTIGPPALVLGTVFPFLMKIEEHYALSPGRSLGRLAAINTAGAILGSLACGFIFLEFLGMWRTMQLMAVLYLVTALILPLVWDIKSIVLKVVAGLFLVLQFTALNPAQLPINSIDTMHQREEILETWEGSDCTVAVARDKYGLSIKINSHYGLGSTGAFMQQKFQADIPLMIKPLSESVFFLGMGTGITAGSALDPQFVNIKRVVACELVPEVITAARKYMTDIDGFDCTGGLFSDPRATVMAEDGRHYLMASKERFDMINADLFVPFRSGAGSLYTKEHFQAVKERLNPGGLFVQWLPLYQVTENEFSIISRTMLEVFDQVSLWRNSFQPGEEVVALVGHPDGSPLPASSIDSSTDKLSVVEGKDYRDLQHLSLPFNSQTVMFFYCGNLSKAKELFAQYPVNTDDKPLIEYMAPRTYRSGTDGKLPWFVGPRLASLVEDVQRICPPESDPLLVNRSARNRRLPLAGTAFHRARLWEVIGDESKCKAAWQRYVKEWTDQ